MAGSTLDLDFSPGLAFADEVYRISGFLVHPMKHHRSFTIVASFGRHAFCLSEESVTPAIESAIGGFAIELRVSQVADPVFSFKVSC